MTDLKVMIEGTVVHKLPKPTVILINDDGLEVLKNPSEQRLRGRAIKISIIHGVLEKDARHALGLAAKRANGTICTLSEDSNSWMVQENE